MYPAPAWRLPRFLEVGRAETLTADLRDAKGQAVPVTSATFALLDASGADVVAEVAATVTAGVATYALAGTFATSPVAYPLPQDPWRERWTLTGATGAPGVLTVEREVHVCRVAPVAHVTAEDLFRLHPQWRRQIPASRAAAGGAYGEVLEVAWEELIGRLLGDGHLPHRALNWWAFAIVHKYLAAAIVARDFSTDNPADSRWDRLADTYAKRADTEYETRTKVQADSDEDGVADTPGTLEAVEPPLFLTAVPHATRGGRREP